jgi:hypothetical protein
MAMGALSNVSCEDISRDYKPEQILEGVRRYLDKNDWVKEECWLTKPDEKTFIDAFLKYNPDRAREHIERAYESVLSGGVFPLEVGSWFIQLPAETREELRTFGGSV